MIKKFFTLFLLIILCLAWETHCSRSSHDNRHRPDSQAVSGQKESENQPEALRPGRRAGLGRGSQPEVRGQGLGLGRMLRDTSVVTLSDKEKETIGMETVKVAYRSLCSYIEAMGKVLAPQTRKAIISYAFPARIAEIHVNIGDWVKEQQKLVTLQSEEVGKAKSEYFKAKADKELAQSNHEREKNLFKRGVGAQKNVLSTEALLKVAHASLDAAEKKLHILGFTEDEVKSLDEVHQVNPLVTLFAPIGGKIIESRAVMGSMIDQTTEILTIMDPRMLWIDAQIFEKDIAKTKIGQIVDITVPAYPGETFSGKVGYIGDILSEETRTITVRTDVENRNLKLKPGMFADIKIYINHEERVLALPQEAILDERDRKIVFRKDNGAFVLHYVEVGCMDNGYCEILSGIKEGDEIATKGNYQLKSKLYQEILKAAGVH